MPPQLHYLPVSSRAVSNRLIPVQSIAVDSFLSISVSWSWSRWVLFVSCSLFRCRRSARQSRRWPSRFRATSTERGHKRSRRPTGRLHSPQSPSQPVRPRTRSQLRTNSPKDTVRRIGEIVQQLGLTSPRATAGGVSPQCTGRCDGTRQGSSRPHGTERPVTAVAHVLT